MRDVDARPKISAKYIARTQLSASVKAGLEADQSLRVLRPAAWIRRRMRFTSSMFSVWHTIVTLPTRAASFSRS